MEHATCGGEREMNAGVWPEFEDAHEGEFDVPIVGRLDVPWRKEGVETDASAEIEGEVEKMGADAGENVVMFDVEGEVVVYEDVVASVEESDGVSRVPVGIEPLKVGEGEWF